MGRVHAVLRRPPQHLDLPPERRQVDTVSDSTSTPSSASA
ncbi:hypothetical protein DB30_02646 [Enhygromyxa salina]|uniref:Uncharacterized protein n=1 Tax=Enhygromyxa salina TaxID=215803 RepID=A0A0C2DD61_9BACT|nr:hypothetical protein DB30_02646 [Enhygromyxa salina]